MAELYQLQYGNVTFECYSERGVMSCVMFHALGQPRQFERFLRSIHFDSTVESPLRSGEITKMTFFSELHLGNGGFGQPDGAIYFELERVPHLLMIEAKANASYRTTTRGRKYANQTRGQLERHYRSVWLYKNGHIRERRGIRELREEQSSFAYTYTDDENTMRILRLQEGVGRFFDEYVQKVDLAASFFLLISNESSFPFGELNADIRPRCYGQTWDTANRHFCWLPWSELEQLAGLHSTRYQIPDSWLDSDSTGDTLSDERRDGDAPCDDLSSG